jgi:TonB family protein
MSRLGNSVLAGLFVVSLADSSAQETANSEATKKKTLAIFAPKPKRSPDWPDGRGVFFLNVNNETGEVKSVEVAQSTGHKVLDDSAVEAFQKWRFKPGTVAPKVKIPITFSQQPLADVWANQRSYALSTPRPEYPQSARAAHITGDGVFVMDVDDSGIVTHVTVMKSTGNETLDNVAVAQLHNWKFKPQTVKIVRVPIKFTSSGAQF